MKYFVCYFFVICIVNININAQNRVFFSGVVLDKDNAEPISFAPVRFTNSSIGKIANQKGLFKFSISDTTTLDTLVISHVGYEPFIFVYKKGDTTTTNWTIFLDKATIKEEVFIKSKYSKSFLLWRKVVRCKNKNNYEQYNYYTYHLHNKIEIDINNIDIKNTDSNKNSLSKKFSPILKNINITDSGKGVLPFYIAETISNIYYQKKPHKKREVIDGVLGNSIENESIIKLLGGSYQNLNFYNNQITFFNKEFISPFANNADIFYNFKILDTQYIDNQRLIHFLFVPKKFSDNTFDGDCWIRDSLYAIQKINLRLNKEANINFINKANFMEEFILINDNTYFLKKVKFVAEVAPTENSKANFLIHRTATYKNISIEEKNVTPEIGKNVAPEEVIIMEEAKEKDSTYWENNRHELSTKSEILAQKTIDTLLKMPTFIHIIDGIKTLYSGYVNVGKFRVGKWWSLLGRNPFSGPRLNLDITNNEKLSKKFYFRISLIVNAREQLFNGGIQLKYIFDQKWWSEISFLYSNNIDLGSYQNVPAINSKDNIFVNLFRRKDIHFILHNIQQTYIGYSKKFPSGIGININLEHQKFIPILRKKERTNDNIRDINPREMKGLYYMDKAGEMINTSVSLEVNYSYLEKFIVLNFKRISLGSKYPIISFSYTKGIPNILNSQYDYHKFKFSIHQTFKKEPFGTTIISTELGKVFGTVPYLLLEQPYANLTIYYNADLFNTILPFEYVMDKYIKAHIKQDFGLGLFRFLPFMKKLKWRQFVVCNIMAGTLSQENFAFNSNYREGINRFHKSLSKTPLIELGVGINNIFKFLSISYFWQLTPYSNPTNQTLMFNFELQF